jgi:hypothetical protein
MLFVYFGIVVEQIELLNRSLNLLSLNVNEAIYKLNAFSVN